MNYKKDTKKGRYVIKYRDKYIGTQMPEFKSAWEQRVFYEMDTLAHVVRWGYEVHDIPYYNPVTKKDTIYKPDLFVTTLVDGNTNNFLIEIKPAAFTKPPAPPKTKDGRKPSPAMIDKYRRAQMAYLINAAKWAAAETWCRRHNVTWLIMDENTSPFMKGY